MRRDGTVPPVSSRRLAAFAWYARRLIRRHFTAVRVMQDTLPPPGPTRARVFYANHAAWWDPLVMLIVARELFPGTAFHAPIDAAALARYPSLQKLGFFGIEPGSPAGARRFLEISRALLARPGTALALTPQGRFADVRERPLGLQGGIARLLMTTPGTLALPVAIEYPFWTEMRPEVLIRFGRRGVGVGADDGRRRADTDAARHDVGDSSTTHARHGAGDSCAARYMRDTRDALQFELTARMTTTLDELASASCRRARSEFVTLLDGTAGIGRLQDTPARLRAWRAGARFDARHSALRATRETRLHGPLPPEQRSPERQA